MSDVSELVSYDWLVLLTMRHHIGFLVLFLVKSPGFSLSFMPIYIIRRCPYYIYIEYIDRDLHCLSLNDDTLSVFIKVFHKESSEGEHTLRLQHHLNLSIDISIGKAMCVCTCHTLTAYDTTCY